MNDHLAALGRGFIKILISLFFGAGVGLVTFGASAVGQSEIWMRREPPAEMFLGVGAGLLTAGIVMFLLFFVVPRFASAAKAESSPHRKPLSSWRDEVA